MKRSCVFAQPYDSIQSSCHQW
eukprot:SAG31_NODE_31843_length_363_cov_0.973485_2_plen_21_part_01